MKRILKNIWNALWKCSVVIIAIAILVVAGIVGYVYYDNHTKYRVKGNLSHHIEVHNYYHRKHSIRIYNRFTEEYITKGLDWIAKPIAGDSLIVFRKGNKFGFIDANTGNVAIDAQYDKAGTFSEGVAAVVKKGNVGFINSCNKVVIPFSFHDISDAESMDGVKFKDGYCTMIAETGRYGIINRQGQWIIEPGYEEMQMLDNGKRIVKQDGKYGLLDETLQLSLPIEYDRIELAKGKEHGLLLSKDGYKWQVDFEGNIIHSFVCDGTTMPLTYMKRYEDYDGGIEVLSDYLTYCVDGCYGVIRKDNGKVIIPALYESISMASSTMFEASLSIDEKYILIGLDGKVVRN